MSLIDSLTPSDLEPPSADQIADHLDSHTEVLARAIEAELRRLVREAVQAYFGSMTAAGDNAALDSIVSGWQTFVQGRVGPYVAGLWRDGAVVAHLSATKSKAAPETLPLPVEQNWAAVTNEAAVRHMGLATNRLVGVGNSVWSQVRTTLEMGTAQGLTGEALKNNVQQVMGTTEFRADTIARTEVIGAYNAGDYASAQALGDYGPKFKMWAAVLDTRTRETHAEADGQVVPFDEPFTVGGEQLMHPLDAGASPENVVNCRCTFEEFYVGDTLPDGSEVGQLPDPTWDAPTYQGTPLSAKPVQPNLGGIHAKTVLTDGSGTDYLFKPAQEWIAHGESAATEIGRLGGVQVPQVGITSYAGETGSFQEMLANARAGFKGSPSTFDPLRVSAADLQDLQQQRALDWLISNHDGHSAQFIRQGYASDGARLIGVDKGQAFKWLGKDTLGYAYKPNEFRPVYHSIEEAWAKGADLADENLFGDKSPIWSTIDRLQAIPDAEYRAMLRPYAEGRFGAGRAAEEFLDTAVRRKSTLKKDFTAYYKRLNTERAANLARLNPPVTPGGPGGLKGMTGATPSKADTAFMRTHDHPLTNGYDHPEVYDYTGSGYRRINSTLRAGGSDASTRGVSKSLGTVKKDMEVYRGTRVHLPAGSTVEDLQGTVFRDRGFLSTSAGERGPGYGAQEIGMRIRVNSGTRGAWVDPMSQNRGEREFIVDADTHLFVHKVRRPKPGTWEGRYQWIVEAETVDKDWVTKQGLKVFDSNARAFK